MRGPNGTRRVRLLGVEVTPMSADDVVESFAELPSAPRLLLNHNLHSVYQYHALPWFKELYDSIADAVLIDGWPVLRLTQGTTSTSQRVGSTDWIARLWESRTDGHRVFILGGDADANAAAVQRFRARMPGATTAGSDGFFDFDSHGVELIRKIAEFRPTLVLVGMGMPRQEQFLLRFWNELPAAYYATVGGAIDYVAGRQHLAPRILGRLGLEWLWRVLHDPRRLARRYFVEPFALGALLIRIRKGEPATRSRARR